MSSGFNWKKYLSESRIESEQVIDPKKDSRNPFEVDFGKVIFCPALRRMHDKTQVIPLSSGDCVSTRLTHSLHVMNIAESLACNYTRSQAFHDLFSNEKDAFEDSQRIRAILKTASLLHDIGNPPFGHFGEATIKDYFRKLFDPSNKSFAGELDETEKLDFLKFDGNALGFRIVSKLQYFGSLNGLNLTYGTLGAFLKYPNENDTNDANIGNHKHGVFKTEHDLFMNVVKECNMFKADGTIKRHPLAFLVEAADTICYGTMDVEDGLYQNWYSMKYLLGWLTEYISSKLGHQKDIRDIIGFNISDEDIDRGDSRQVRLDLREHLITYLVDLTIRNFNDNLNAIDEGGYNKELVYDDPLYVAEALQVFTKKEILSNRGVLKFEITGNSVITGLFDLLINYFFHNDKAHHARLHGIISESRMAVAMMEDLPNKYPPGQVLSSDVIAKFDVGEMSQYGKLRMIVDFVASMTDKYSVELYQTLSGNSL